MSDTPQKTGRIAQIRDAYRAIKSIDPKLGQWMLLAALLTSGAADSGSCTPWSSPFRRPRWQPPWS